MIVEQKNTTKKVQNTGEIKVSKLTPLEDRIVVEQNTATEKTPGGIYLPEKAKEKPTRGVVLFAGPGKMLENGERAQMQVQVGNEIVYDRYSATEIEINTKKYVILRESEVLAIIEK